jgi:hypothetical protein
LNANAKIGFSKHDCLGALFLEQLLTNSIEDQTLGLAAIAT